LQGHLPIVGRLLCGHEIRIQERCFQTCFQSEGVAVTREQPLTPLQSFVYYQSMEASGDEIFDNYQRPQNQT
jgi:hypothetical protein